MNKKQFHILV